jgi:hypothetical protein
VRLERDASTLQTVKVTDESDSTEGVAVEAKDTSLLREDWIKQRKKLLFTSTYFYSVFI